MQLLYLIALLLPMLVVVILQPRVALSAHRKKVYDFPNERKQQSKATLCLGGLVIVASISFTLLIINTFYNIDSLFPVMCVMMMLFSLGLVDDTMNIGYRVKLFVQFIIITALFFAGCYRFDDLGGLWGVSEMPLMVSYLLSLAIGITYINGANFSDGVDGLCSGLGVLFGICMSIWNIRHGYVADGILSLALSGTLLIFNIFNVFSEKYKMYMGDSGSLVIGMFAYISMCPPSYSYIMESRLIDYYFMSYFVAIFAVIVIDPIRVAVMRVVCGKSPFMPDRTHLHHMLVDTGYTHLLTTAIILGINITIVIVWYITARMGMMRELQFMVVVGYAVAVIVGTYFVLRNINKKGNIRYQRHVERISEKSERFRRRVMRIIEGKKK